MNYENTSYSNQLDAIIFLSCGNITLCVNNNDENLNFLLFKEGGRGVYTLIKGWKHYNKFLF